MAARSPIQPPLSIVAGTICEEGRSQSAAGAGNLPKGADWHGAKLLAERQGRCSGVEDDAGDEVVAEAVGESA
jgi:hypothetical protein